MYSAANLRVCRASSGIPSALPSDQELGEILLIPAMPMVNMGHTSMFVPLNFISKARQYTGHHANQLTNQLMDFVCKQTAAACGATHEIRHHKLKHEEVGGADYYTQSCNSLRAAHLLQSANDTTLLKVYHGLWYWTSTRWRLELSGDNKGHGHPGRLLAHPDSKLLPQPGPLVCTPSHMRAQTLTRISYKTCV